MEKRYVVVDTDVVELVVDTDVVELVVEVVVEMHSIPSVPS